MSTTTVTTQTESTRQEDALVGLSYAQLCAEARRVSTYDRPEHIGKLIDVAVRQHDRTIVAFHAHVKPGESLSTWGLWYRRWRDFMAAPRPLREKMTVQRGSRKGAMSLGETTRQVGIAMKSADGGPAKAGLKAIGRMRSMRGASTSTYVSRLRITLKTLVELKRRGDLQVFKDGQLSEMLRLCGEIAQHCKTEIDRRAKAAPKPARKTLERR